MNAARPLYKVVVNGRSCHGGSLEWSLPTDGAPGEWHAAGGPLVPHQHGLHVTDDPARWWVPGCTIYLAEVEGVVGSCDDTENRKVVCRRVRLLREATREELAALRICAEGSHVVTDLSAVALGSSHVVARGSSRVEALGSSSVEARDSSRVVARDSSTVVTWSGAPSVGLAGRAVWIERGLGDSAPVIHVVGAPNV